MAKQLTQPGSKAPKKKPGAMAFIFPLILLRLLGTAGWFLYSGLQDYNTMRNMVLTWEQVVHVADTEDPDAPTEYVEVQLGHNAGTENGEPGETAPVATTKQAALQPKEDYLYRPINLAALRALNPDVDGYIYIPNSSVDYPVMKEPEPEKYYYLDHNINKEYDRYGAIFEISDLERGLPSMDNPLTWMFGHHMASGSMFATLYNYEDEDFYDNPIYVYHDDWRAEYEAFGYCLVGETDPAYDFDGYARGTDDYQELLDYLKSKNAMKKDKGWPDKDDDVLILSTCYGGAGTSWRMILLCREVRRAMVPDYYENEWEVDQYGGDKTPVPESELTGEKPENPVSGMDGIMGSD